MHIYAHMLSLINFPRPPLFWQDIALLALVGGIYKTLKDVHLQETLMADECLHLPFACDDTKDICFVFLS